MELLWEILLVVMDYITHVWIFKYIPWSEAVLTPESVCLKSFPSNVITSYVFLGKLISISYQRMGIRIAPISRALIQIK